MKRSICAAIISIMTILYAGPALAWQCGAGAIEGMKSEHVPRRSAAENQSFSDQMLNRLNDLSKTQNYEDSSQLRLQGAISFLQQTSLKVVDASICGADSQDEVLLKLSNGDVVYLPLSKH